MERRLQIHRLRNYQRYIMTALITVHCQKMKYKIHLSIPLKKKDSRMSFTGKQDRMIQRAVI